MSKGVGWLSGGGGEVGRLWNVFLGQGGGWVGG